MIVEILDFVEDVYNYKLGKVDIKVIYSEEKQEIFRDLSYFKKDGKKWCTFPNVKRRDKWIPVYERKPPVSKSILDQAADKIENYLVEAEMGL